MGGGGRGGGQDMTLNQTINYFENSTEKLV